MLTVHTLTNVPSVGDYVKTLTSLGTKVTDQHRALFRAHYLATDRAITAMQLASRVGIANWVTVNSLYGTLGHALSDALGIKPELRPDDTYKWWSVWSRGWNTPGGFVWQMHPQVAEALEQLGWVTAVAGFTLADEIAESAGLVEGALRSIMVNAYERSSQARQECIAVHGTACCICGFDFGAVFGPEAEGYIHVHHLRPLSEADGEHPVDPVADLRPVCPNCHAMIHLGGVCRSIEEVKSLRDIQEQQRSRDR